MRLATRMKLTYGTVFIVPLILMFVTFWGNGTDRNAGAASEV